MPPYVGWYQGAEKIGELIEIMPGGPGDMLMLRDVGERPAGVRLVHGSEDGSFHPFQLQVLELASDRVRHASVSSRPGCPRRSGSGCTPGRVPPAVCGHESAMTAGSTPWFLPSSCSNGPSDTPG